MESGFSSPWPAPAKLNLMLRIVGRRADGYHLLQTVFQFIDRCDQVRFRLRADEKILRVTELSGVPPEQDLTVRAARVLQRRFSVPFGVDIAVEKRLPMGGGLGGGSSDAATVLVALNHYWSLGIGRDELAEIGASLGADVPVFIGGEAAWAEGIGDELSPVELPEPWYLVAAPDCHVATDDIFGDPDLTRDSARITIRDFLAGGRGNDCVSVVMRRYPQLRAISDWMGCFGEPRLTGTGACMFVDFDTAAEANEVLTKMPRQYGGFVARGLNHSPLWSRVHA